MGIHYNWIDISFDDVWLIKAFTKNSIGVKLWGVSYDLVILFNKQQMGVYYNGIYRVFWKWGGDIC